MNLFPPPPSWAKEIHSVGVTGTKGKSSTVHFLSAALACTGDAVARVSTVDATLDAGPNAALDTRPPLPRHVDFIEFMAELRAVDAPRRRAVVEATSATLAAGFARAWPFELAVFTNLGHDHQKTHPSFEHYLAAKAQLFVALEPGGVAVLNAGDPRSELIAEVLGPEVRALWYAGPDAACERSVDLRVCAASPCPGGLELRLERGPDTALGAIPPSLRLATRARFQAPNAAAALLAALALGLPGRAAAEAIARCPSPPGRFESVAVAGENLPQVIVDYAHTPESLSAALISARACCAGRLWLVVGAGGDADPSKRAPLGHAARQADRVILTSDNPRHEDPAAITAQIREGLADHAHIDQHLDRREAIARAIAGAKPEDLVLIVGKGHEQVQEVGGERLPFDDRSVAADALAHRAAST